MEQQFRLNWPAIVEEAKQRRKSLRLTQGRLAILAEVSTPTISRFEIGRKDIQLSSIMNILGMLGMVDHRTLVFPDPRPHYDPNRELLIFFGQASDKKIQCAISREALGDHYKAAGKTPLKTFRLHQSSIEHEARRKYLANRLESDGSLLIKYQDL